MPNELSAVAYAKIMAHAAKYPHAAVDGLLLARGPQTGAPRGAARAGAPPPPCAPDKRFPCSRSRLRLRVCTTDAVADAVPLRHSKLTVSLGLDGALRLVRAHDRSWTPSPLQPPNCPEPPATRERGVPPPPGRGVLSGVVGGLAHCGRVRCKPCARAGRRRGSDRDAARVVRPGALRWHDASAGAFLGRAGRPRGAGAPLRLQSLWRGWAGRRTAHGSLPQVDNAHVFDQRQLAARVR